MILSVKDESSMLALGQSLAKASLKQGPIIYLNGNLGAGKTTMVRGFLTGLGHQGKVKSPTYTLVEPYELANTHIYHFDLYRLGDPEELEYIGIRDYFDEDAIVLLEWSEKGEGMIAPADIIVDIDYDLPGRTVRFSAKSTKGAQILENLP